MSPLLFLKRKCLYDTQEDVLVSGEIRPSEQGYGRGLMGHMPVPGPYLKDGAFAGFPS